MTPFLKSLCSSYYEPDAFWNTEDTLVLAVNLEGSEVYTQGFHTVVRFIAVSFISNDIVLSFFTTYQAVNTRTAVQVNSGLILIEQLKPVSSKRGSNSSETSEQKVDVDRIRKNNLVPYLFQPN